MIKILIFSLALVGSLYAAERLTISAPATIIAGEKEQVFKVEDNSVIFSHSAIREMAFGEDMTVAYKNTTNSSLSPKFVLKIYNQYGFLLSEKKVGGSLFGGLHLKKGELGGDKIYLDWIDYKEAFKHSNFVLPEDFSTISWISISKANFAIQP